LIHNLNFIKSLMDTTIPKFGPSSRNTSYNDLIDLNDVFSDLYFPQDIDFTSFLNNNDMIGFDDNSYNIDMDYFLDSKAPSIKQEEIEDNNIANNTNTNNDTLTMNKLSTSADVIMIPPALPTRISQIRIKRELVPPKESQNMKDTIALSKFSKSSKLSTLQSINKSNIKNDYDSDSDNNTEKRRRGVYINPKDMNEQQRLERSYIRERNREHAKRSRIRKKLLLDTLQDQLLGLRSENVLLRRIVTERLPPNVASKIFNECTTAESVLLLDDPPTISLSHDDSNYNKAISSKSIIPRPVQQARILMEPDFRLIQALLHSQQNFVISDPSLPDNPIVYASDGFCKLSGYKKSEILGRNCRFLQGPGTDQNAVDMIRKGVQDGSDISVCLLNYKADGTPFWNQFFVAALRDAEGNVINFVGVQCEVNSLPVSEIKDRVKKLPLPDGYL